MKKRNIIVGITGASGQIYAKELLDSLYMYRNQFDEIAVIFSDTGKETFIYELGGEAVKNIPFKIYDNNNFFVAPASGSSKFDTLIILPCTMGTLGRIAGGSASDLISRTADVMLKERRKLIIVPRETPYNLIHIKNMETLTQAGGIICPASPSFYSKPQTINDLVKTVVERILNLADIEFDSYQWQGK